MHKEYLAAGTEVAKEPLIILLITTQTENLKFRIWKQMLRIFLKFDFTSFTNVLIFSKTNLNNLEQNCGLY